MIATTIEQSERLLRCGISADTADMHYEIVRKVFSRKRVLNFGFESEFMGKAGYYPAWSLSPLLYELDKLGNEVFNEHFVIDILKTRGVPWSINVFSARGLVTGLNNDDFLEGCVSMIERLQKDKKTNGTI